MKQSNKANNWRDFNATCSEAEIKETEKYFYKEVSMFGSKILIYWKESGRISTRENNIDTVELYGIKYAVIEINSNKLSQSFLVSTEELSKIFSDEIEKDGSYKTTESRNLDESLAYFVPAEIIQQGKRKTKKYIQEHIDEEI